MRAFSAKTETMVEIFAAFCYNFPFHFTKAITRPLPAPFAVKTATKSFFFVLISNASTGLRC